MTRMQTLSLLALGAAAFVARPAEAQQITEVSRTQPGDAAQVTFGFLCDDRFVLRNDGTQPITLEYGLQGGAEHTKVTLQSRESVELASKSRDPMELWMDGKRIATAEKERRSCKDVNGAAGVTVNQPQVVTTDRGPTYVYAAYPYWDPFWNPWYSGISIGFGVRGPMHGGIIVARPMMGGRIGRHR